MNNPYLQERLVELKQQEIQRELEQARLLREARPSGPGLLTRAVKFLHRVANIRRKVLRDHASVEQRSYQSLSD